MLKDQQETPNLIIPKNFDKFINSIQFLRMINSIYYYCVVNLRIS
jgi:hypothetical protein